MKKRFPGRISDWVLHKDNQLVVFNKPAGLPVQPDRSEGPNLQQIGAAYIRHDLYLIHRLDRPVSGVVAMGQRAGAQGKVSEEMKAGGVQKIYLAIVAEPPPQPQATLKHYLTDGPKNRTLVSEEETAGSRYAELDYQLLARSDRYHLLRVDLKTGRKHQIRAQLGAIGCPVRGDEKYGFRRRNPDGNIDLHAYQLHLTHPGSGKRMIFTAPPPDTPVWQAFADQL